MTNRECAKRNIRLKGRGYCGMCELYESECASKNTNSECVVFCQQWLIDNPEIPELNPILCTVWNNGTAGYAIWKNTVKIVGKLNGKYLDMDNGKWDNAEPTKEKKERPMTRDEKIDYLSKIIQVDFPMVEEKKRHKSLNNKQGE